MFLLCGKNIFSNEIILEDTGDAATDISIQLSVNNSTVVFSLVETRMNSDMWSGLQREL